jgi:hypothetical protein
MAVEDKPREKRSMLGCFVAVLALVAVFLAGVWASGDVRSILGDLVFDASEFAADSPANPYDLRIVVRRGVNGKLEVFLQDSVTGRARRLGADLASGPAEVLQKAPDAIIETIPGRLKGAVKDVYEDEKPAATEEAKPEKPAATEEPAEEATPEEPAPARKPAEGAEPAEPVPAEPKAEEPAQEAEPATEETETEAAQ